MSLLTVIVVLLLVGIGLWVLNTKGTMIDNTIKQIINFVVIVVVIIWLLKVFGLLDSLSTVTV